MRTLQRLDISNNSFVALPKVVLKTTGLISLIARTKQRPPASMAAHRGAMLNPKHTGATGPFADHNRLFYSGIDPAIGDLKQLTNLDLSYNQLEYDEAKGTAGLSGPLRRSSPSSAFPPSPSGKCPTACRASSTSTSSTCPTTTSR